MLLLDGVTSLHYVDERRHAARRMNALRKVVRRLGRRPRVEYRIVMMRDLSADLPSFDAGMPVELEELPADARLVEEAVAAMPPAHRFGVPQRIAAGDVCWVARSSGTVLYQAWVGIGATYSYTLERRFPLASTDVTVYGAYTLPAYRDRGIHTAAVTRILAVLRERGLRRIVLLMEPNNRAALRMPEKLHFRTIGWAGFAELAGIRFHFLHDRGVLAHVRSRHYCQKV